MRLSKTVDMMVIERFRDDEKVTAEWCRNEAWVWLWLWICRGSARTGIRWLVGVGTTRLHEMAGTKRFTYEVCTHSEPLLKDDRGKV